jgi:hypothetical protein
MDRNAFAGVEEFLSEIYIKVTERMKRNIYVQTCRQTDMQTCRQTDRHTDIQIGLLRRADRENR